MKIRRTTAMLLPDNLHPEKCIYFNGSFVLRALQKDKKIDLLNLYQRVISEHRMTFSVFILCLDWLYLLDVAILNKDGEVELCS